MAVLDGILAKLTDADLGRVCGRSPAPGYPEQERGVAECLAVVLEEECEHYRYAVRDLTKTFRLNGSLFFYDFMDAQVPFTEFRTGINITNFRNTDAESYGAELESVWALTPNLSLLLTGSSAGPIGFSRPSAAGRAAEDQRDPPRPRPGASDST